MKSNEPLVKYISDDAYANLLYYVSARAAYKEEKVVGISKLLEGLSEKDLRQNNATFHTACRKWLVSPQKLERAKTRFEKATESKSASVLSRASGRPSIETQTCSLFPVCDERATVYTGSKRILRSYTAAYQKELCFFCQTHDEKQPVHAIQCESRGKQLSDLLKIATTTCIKYFLAVLSIQTMPCLLTFSTTAPVGQNT